MKLVARLKVIKVRAVVPVVLQASAQRVTSKTDDVNSARPKRVRCDARLRIRMVRAGFFVMNDDKYGCSTELL